ncbi:MAG: hypothetical protein ACK56C_14995 [Alphaproteobacteria bacterium]
MWPIPPPPGHPGQDRSLDEYGDRLMSGPGHVNAY